MDLISLANLTPVSADLKALFDYLTCPRIRMKTYHPLFLKLRYSNVVCLYYNKDKVPNETRDKMFVN
jgi:hypothetical protein